MMVEFPKYVFLGTKMCLVRSAEERVRVSNWQDELPADFPPHNDPDYSDVNDVPAELLEPVKPVKKGKGAA